VAALAYGTTTVPRVDKVVGPGNIYVATAKRLCYGRIDIDSIAGPSEVLVVADGSADARIVAADMLAQAEHDPMAASICLTSDSRLAARVVVALREQLATLPRRATAARSLATYGAVVVTARSRRRSTWRTASHRTWNHRARSRALAPRRCATPARFSSARTPEAFGDYLAGPNHVLPTGGAPLGVAARRLRFHEADEA
jgi:histidinol dehydrogenase